MTDIDAAILDYVTGELVLFQLKWQDFDSSNLRIQRSKAKNFVDKVEAWGPAVSSWIDDHGLARLCEVLKLKLPAGNLPVTIWLGASAGPMPDSAALAMLLARRF